jgi:hypothetical protein
MNQKTILIVDDEQCLVSSNARIFRSKGWRVLEATTTADAVKYLPLADVVLSDYDIDTSGGGEYILKSSKVPVIIYTGSFVPIRHPWLVIKPVHHSVLVNLATELAENNTGSTDIRPLNQVG